MKYAGYFLIPLIIFSVIYTNKAKNDNITILSDSTFIKDNAILDSLYSNDTLLNNLNQSDNKIFSNVNNISNKIIDLKTKVSNLENQVKILSNENKILKGIISSYNNESSEPVRFFPVEDKKK